MRVVSVNVGVPRTVEWHGRAVTSAIWKQAVDGPVAVDGVNLHGDDQADRRVHGGADKAVYAYAAEDYAFWARRGAARAGHLRREPHDRGPRPDRRPHRRPLARRHRGARGVPAPHAVLQAGHAPRRRALPRALRRRRAARRLPADRAAGPRGGGRHRRRRPGRPAGRRGGALAADDVADHVLRLALDDERVPESWRTSARRALGHEKQR